MERKSIGFEVKDFSKGKRTAVIAHAVYNNIDRVGDISVKGMFSSSWKRGDDVSFYFNHDDNQSPGKVLRTFEDEEKAYTEVEFGPFTLGNDVLEMVDFGGVIKGASFGYETEKKEFISKSGRNIRRLLQVKHFETSLLTKLPANPLAGVVSYNKSVETKKLTDTERQALIDIAMNDQSTLETLINLSGKMSISDDLYDWVTWTISRRAESMSSVRSQLRYNSEQVKSIKAHVDVLERFTRNTTASDDCIKSLQQTIHEYKSILSAHDTVSTPLITDGDTSVKEFSNALHLLTLKI